MRSVTYSMGVSLDGYIVGPDGNFGWSIPTKRSCASVTTRFERLRAEPREDDIAIGGATLAAEADALGLIDEYQARVYPVLVGGGTPFFPQCERRVGLELVETRTFNSGVVYFRYSVAR